MNQNNYIPKTFKAIDAGLVLGNYYELLGDIDKEQSHISSAETNYITAREIFNFYLSYLSENGKDPLDHPKIKEINNKINKLRDIR